MRGIREIIIDIYDTYYIIHFGGRGSNGGPQRIYLVSVQQSRRCVHLREVRPFRVLTKE